MSVYHILSYIDCIISPCTLTSLLFTLSTQQQKLLEQRQQIERDVLLKHRQELEKSQQTADELTQFKLSQIQQERDKERNNLQNLNQSITFNENVLHDDEDMKHLVNQI